MRFHGGVAVIGAGIRSRHGKGWRGMAAHGQKQQIPIDEPVGPQEARSRNLMSRPALLATLATKDVLAELHLNAQEKTSLGLFMGVGSSCGDMRELQAMLEASMQANVFSLDKFWDGGLRACNPLYAFELMNNFTMCHAAIVNTLTGPNACLFSRGAGTVFALEEAAASVRGGLCEHALVGGSDSCLHPVTLFEMQTQAWQVDDPSEGAAVIALAPQDEPWALAYIEDLWICQGSQPLPASSPHIRGSIDALVLSGRGERLDRVVASIVASQTVPPKQYDVDSVCGETLAAGPAIAWCVALDCIDTAHAHRVAVVGGSVDGDVYYTLFTRSRPR